MKLNIGQKLFKLNGTKGLYSYVVKEISMMKDNDRILETYVVECQNCSHGYNCLIRIGEDKDNRYEKRFKYIEMLTDDDENEYYYYHNEGFYYTNEKKAYEVLKEKVLELQKKKIEKMEETLKNEKRIYENYMLFFENRLKKLEEK
jgi:hypothetical protein